MPGGPYRYVALPAGHSTVVQQLRRTGPVHSSIRVPGRYGIPGVDYSGSTTGLSADGDTLVLAELWGNRTPRTTRLIVLGAPRLNVRARIVLRGSFTLFILGAFCAGLYAAAHQSYRFAAADTASERFRPKAIAWVLAGGVFAGVIGPQLVIATKDLWPPLFAATAYPTEPLPMPDVPEVGVIQLALLTAVHPHVDTAVTATVPVPPLAPKLCDVGEVVPQLAP